MYHLTLFYIDDFLLAHGVAEAPTWVQIANPTSKTVVLRVGQHVGDFHPREGIDVKEINITPTGEELQEEQRLQLQHSSQKLTYDVKNSSQDLTGNVKGPSQEMTSGVMKILQETRDNNFNIS